jgi:hypothetical protein
MSMDAERVSGFTLTGGRTVTALRAYLGGTLVDQQVRAVIYGDVGGVPGALVVTSSQVVVAAGQADGWVTFPLPAGVPLTSGRYWLGLWSGGAGAAVFGTAAGGQRTMQQEPYSTTADPSSPWTGTSVMSGAVTIHAVCGTAPTTSTTSTTTSTSSTSSTSTTLPAGVCFGDGTVPAAMTATMSMDAERVSGFTLTGSRTVTALRAYLGGNLVDQQVRAVIYGDGNGVPGALVDASTEVVVAAGQASGWVTFPLSAGVSLAPGQYWLGLWSGGAGPAVFGTAAGGQRIMQQEPYSSTADPSSPWTGTSTMSGAVTIHAVCGTAPTTSTTTTTSTSSTTSSTVPVGPCLGSSAAPPTMGATMTPGQQRVSPLVLGGSVRVARLRAYVQGNLLDQQIRAVIYDADGTVPGALRGVSAEVVVAAGQAAGWVSLPFPALVSLTPGTYYLGLWSGGPGAAAVGTGSTGARLVQIEPYGSTGNPSAVWNGTTSLPGALAVYAECG